MGRVMEVLLEVLESGMGEEVFLDPGLSRERDKEVEGES